MDLQKGTKPEVTLERKRDGIRPGAAQEINDNTQVPLYVPDKSRGILEDIVDQYINGDLTKGGEPPNKDKIEPIEAIRGARLETFWTDEPKALPQNPEDEIWWEV